MQQDGRASGSAPPARTPGSPAAARATRRPAGTDRAAAAPTRGTRHPNPSSGSYSSITPVRRAHAKTFLAKITARSVSLAPAVAPAPAASETPAASEAPATGRLRLPSRSQPAASREHAASVALAPLSSRRFARHCRFGRACRYVSQLSRRSLRCSGASSGIQCVAPYFLVAPRGLHELPRGAHPLAVQVQVAVRPDAERGRGHRGELGRRGGRSRREVGAIPVERRGERARLGQAGDGAVDVLVAGCQLAELGPAVVPRGSPWRRLRTGRTADTRTSRAAARVIGVSEMRHLQRGQCPHSVGQVHGGEPGHRRTPVMPDHVRPRRTAGVEDGRHVGDRVSQLIMRPDLSGGRSRPKPRRSGVITRKPCAARTGTCGATARGVRPAVQQQHRCAPPCTSTYRSTPFASRS